MLVHMSANDYTCKHRSGWVLRECAICGAKAIGVNFGAPTCAPCKAFFRRNARRKELLQLPCQFRVTESSLVEPSTYCSQIRHCSSCRLNRCFDVGMKESLVRTEAEKQRYRELVKSNRQRRDDFCRSQQRNHHRLALGQPMVSKDPILCESDWILLSNIVNAYDNYCLKHYIQQRRTIFDEEIDSSRQMFSTLKFHNASMINHINSLLSFLLSMPIVQSLSSSDRVYLCKHNIRPLVFPNMHELEQTCFSESWQLQIDNIATEYVCGKTLFLDYLRIKRQASSILITDSVVTRLWLIVLFFSTPLYCYRDLSSPELSSQRKLTLNQLQNSYALLLWNYLSHRHGHGESVRIFSNLIRIYLQMQSIAQAANTELRTRAELATLNQAFNRASIYERDVQE